MILTETKPTTPISLNESLSGFLKNLATGDVEGDVEELTKEVNDIHTPEQQSFVLTKILRLLERLIVLRHNPARVDEFIHDRLAWFERAIGGKSPNAGKELKTRISENIATLARIRDKALAKKWDNDAYNERIEKIKEKAADLVRQASRTEAKFD